LRVAPWWRRSFMWPQFSK